jgi:hypothetical protein
MKSKITGHVVLASFFVDHRRVFVNFVSVVTCYTGPAL